MCDGQHRIAHCELTDALSKCVHDTRHLRSRSSEAQGQKITFPSPIHISNLMLAEAYDARAAKRGVSTPPEAGA